MLSSPSPSAEFELRQLELSAARKTLGEAVGRRPKAKLFDYYIRLELQLGNIDRKLFEKYITFAPENCKAWSSWADLERMCGEVERARALYELAIKQNVLDMPEVVWKNYIDFETSLKEDDRARDLYVRLLERTKHVKVWISYANFELGLAGDNNVELARQVYTDADDYFRKMGSANNEESWLEFEKANGDEQSVKTVERKQPTRIKKKRVITDNGTEAGWEEYYDYTFPDDAHSAPNMKLFERVRLWKEKKSLGLDYDDQ